MRRIISTVDRWWTNGLNTAVLLVSLALIVAGHTTHHRGIQLAGQVLIVSAAVVSLSYVVPLIGSIRRLRAARRARKATRL